MTSSTDTASTNQQQKQMIKSFYKRPLPETCIALSSRKGRQIFASSLSQNGLSSFFPLIQQL